MKTVKDILNKKDNNEKISVITAYDYTSSVILQDTDMDIILVGDSAANVMAGYDSTIPITIDEMIYHCRSVVNGNKNGLVVADMPFLSYQPSIRDAVYNAGRFLKESGVTAVKVEGGKRVIPQIEGIVAADIPVMGHLGLTPQSINVLGKYKVQGITNETALKIYNDALLLEQTGVFSLVLECIPYKIAKVITEKLSIPTIGIGSGPYCDGQVLVWHDLFGLYDKIQPKFVKQYLNLKKIIKQAADKYVSEVKNQKFPTVSKHSFKIDKKEYKKFYENIQKL